MVDEVRELAAALDAVDGGMLVVVTGAGVSVASGVPTFRGTDPGAIWKRDLTELATRSFFERDPVASWTWYLARFDGILAGEPNAAHRALVDLEDWQRDRGGDFLLVTQNIDPYHERAGSRELIKVHGSADRVRCSTTGCTYGAPSGSLPRDEIDLSTFRREPSRANLPRCSECAGWLRQHVLWFDEYYNEHRDYGWDRVQAAAAGADLLLFVGTSFSVGVTELFRQAAQLRRVPCFSIDPGAEAARGPGLTTLAHPAEDLLPSVLEALSR